MSGASTSQVTNMSKEDALAYLKIENDLRTRIHSLTMDMNSCLMLESKNEIQRLISVNVSILNMFLAKRARDQQKVNLVTNQDKDRSSLSPTVGELSTFENSRQE